MLWSGPNARTDHRSATLTRCQDFSASKTKVEFGVLPSDTAYCGM